MWNFFLFENHLIPHPSLYRARPFGFIWLNNQTLEFSLTFAGRRNATNSSQLKVTKMLLIVSTVFVCLNLPSCIMRIITYIEVSTIVSECVCVSVCVCPCDKTSQQIHILQSWNLMIFLRIKMVLVISHVTGSGSPKKFTMWQNFQRTLSSWIWKYDLQLGKKGKKQN